MAGAWAEGMEMGCREDAFEEEDWWERKGGPDPRQ